jgi:hypothetical protein
VQKRSAAHGHEERRDPSGRGARCVHEIESVRDAPKAGGEVGRRPHELAGRSGRAGREGRAARSRGIVRA